MSRVSVTIIAWNEEDRLKACLESVGWADEIIVIDAESTDKTVQVAREISDRTPGTVDSPAPTVSSSCTPLRISRRPTRVAGSSRASTAPADDIWRRSS